jgi:hypothetical protein
VTQRGVNSLAPALSSSATTLPIKIAPIWLQGAESERACGI